MGKLKFVEKFDWWSLKNRNKEIHQSNLPRPFTSCYSHSLLPVRTSGLLGTRDRERLLETSPITTEQTVQPDFISNVYLGDMVLFLHAMAFQVRQMFLATWYLFWVIICLFIWTFIHLFTHSWIWPSIHLSRQPASQPASNELLLQYVGKRRKGFRPWPGKSHYRVLGEHSGPHSLGGRRLRLQGFRSSKPGWGARDTHRL